MAEHERFVMPPEQPKVYRLVEDPVIDALDPFEGSEWVEVHNPWARPPNAHDREAFKDFLRTKRRDQAGA